MKKFLSLLLSLAMLLSVAALADETHGNYSDEMKIPYAVDLSPEDGADSVERAGDHVTAQVLQPSGLLQHEPRPTR